VVVLAWICAAFFALCGAGLVVSGFYASGAATAIAVLLGVVVASGSVPFIRSARRMRKTLKTAPLDDAARASRRHKIKSILGFYVVLIVSNLVLPVPGVLRGVMVISAVLVVPLVLIAEFDSVKRR